MGPDWAKLEKGELDFVPADGGSFLRGDQHTLVGRRVHLYIESADSEKLRAGKDIREVVMKYVTVDSDRPGIFSFTVGASLELGYNHGLSIMAGDEIQELIPPTRSEVFSGVLHRVIRAESRALIQ